PGVAAMEPRGKRGPAGPGAVSLCRLFSMSLRGSLTSVHLARGLLRQPPEALVDGDHVVDAADRPAEARRAVRPAERDPASQQRLLHRVEGAPKAAVVLTRAEVQEFPRLDRAAAVPAQADRPPGEVELPAYVEGEALPAAPRLEGFRCVAC